MNNMADWWYRTRNKLLCHVGHHDWSCRGSRRCMGMGDHYCLRCLYGLPDKMKNQLNNMEGDK